MYIFDLQHKYVQFKINILSIINMKTMTTLKTKNGISKYNMRLRYKPLLHARELFPNEFHSSLNIS